MSCGGNKDKDGGNGDSKSGWPSATILAKYGLDGFTKPTGASKEYFMEVSEGQDVSISFSFEGTTATTAAIKKYFEDKGWDLENETPPGGMYSISYSKETASHRFYASMSVFSGNVFSLSVQKFTF